MTTNTEVGIACLSLKPLCDEIMREPNQNSIRTLLQTFHRLPPNIKEEIQTLVVYPLIHNLKTEQTRNRSELLCFTVDSMCKLLNDVKINSKLLYEQCMQSLFKIIFDRNQEGSVARISEELKLSVITAMTVITSNLEGNLKPDLYKPPLSLMIVGSLFVCVHIAKQEKMRSLKITAIKCIRELTSTSYEDQSTLSDKLEKPVVELLRSILPGVLAALQDVALAKDNQGHAVIEIALSTLTRILCLVMADKYVQSEKKVNEKDFVNLFNEKSKEKKNGEGTPKPNENLVEWYKFANIKLETVVKVLTPLQNHEHANVRRQLAIFASRLLSECSCAMSTSIPHALNILITLNDDPYEAVSHICKEALENYFGQDEIVRWTTVNCLANNFFDVLSSVPRIMNDIDSGRKNSMLDMLRGYIEIMNSNPKDNKLTQVLTIEGNVRSLCDSLIEVVTLDNSGLSLLEDVGIKDLMEDNVSRPWHRLKHIDSKETLDRIHRVLAVLANCECCDFVIDCLLSMLKEEWSKAGEIIYLVNHICVAKTSKPSSDSSILQRVMVTYIDPELWHLPLEIGEVIITTSSDETFDVQVYDPNKWDKDYVPGLYEGAVETRFTDINLSEPRVLRRDKSKCQNVLEAQNNMAICCHVTEGLGIIALSVGVHFKKYLLKTLTLILERVGSQYECLHNAGTICLNSVSKACNYENPEELIRENFDYLSHHLTVKLKKAWHTIPALKILSVVLQHSDARIVPNLETIFTDILVKSCDKHHEQATLAFLELFLSFVRNVKRWFPPKVNDIIINDRDSEKGAVEFNLSTIFDNSDERFDDQDVNKSAQEMFEEDMRKNADEDPLDYDDRVTSERDKKPIPHHVNMAIAILKKCLNFISSKKQKQKIVSIQVINEGFPILKEYEDELLPLVHLVWAPLVERFSETDCLVVNRAFQLLCTMGNLSKDFIRNRTVKEVLPKLCDFLKKSSKDSYLKDKGSSYRQTQQFKLQDTVLAQISFLTINLDLSEKDFIRVMETVSQYLSCRQPKSFQDHAVKCFRAWMDVDTGLTWEFLRCFCKNSEVIAPTCHEEIPLATVVGTPFHPIDLFMKDNVQRIFEALH